MLDTNELPGKSSIYYPFAVDRSYYFNFKQNPLTPQKGKGTVQFSLQKNGEVTSQNSFSSVLDECPHVSTFGDKKNIIVSDESLDLTASLSSFWKTIELQNKLPEYSFQLIPDGQVSTQISPAGSVYVMIEKSTGDKIQVYAKQNTKSKKLSCNLVNVLRRNDLDSMIGLFDEDKDTDLTLNAESVIVLAIPEKDQEKIAKIILQGIAHYFEREPYEKEFQK